MKLTIPSHALLSRARQQAVFALFLSLRLAALTVPSGLAPHRVAGDVGKRTLDSFVLHGRGAGDYAEVAVLGQSSDEFVGHAIGEVVLGGIARQIRERENGKGMDLRGLGGGKKASADEEEDEGGGCGEADRDRDDHFRLG